MVEKDMCPSDEDYHERHSFYRLPFLESYHYIGHIAAQKYIENNIDNFASTYSSSSQDNNIASKSRIVNQLEGMVRGFQISTVPSGSTAGQDPATPGR